jgi:hypothetical protein
MADTTYLKRVVECFVRDALTREFGTRFESRFLPLSTGGTHEFDAVSEDGRIVASIKSASGKTAGGKNPSGKIKDSIAELYFLSLATAPIRMLVLTSPEFHAIMSGVLAGRLAAGLSLKLVPLPQDIQERVEHVQKAASQEVSLL